MKIRILNFDIVSDFDIRVSDLKYFMAKILSIAHRGASGYAPENTLKAIQKAVKLGADMIEIDVRRTRDRHMVCFHDYLMHRLTNGHGRLRNYTYQELKRFTICGEVIPTLPEILKEIKGSCQVNIEVKERGLTKDLARLVREMELTRDVLFSSFYHLELAKLKALDSRLRVALLFSQLPSVSVAMKIGKEIQAEALNLPMKRITQRYLRQMIDEAKRRDMKINVWTANSQEDIQWLKETGVHGIITDFPDRIKSIS